MESQIKNYADSVYQQLLMESVAKTNTDRSNYLREMAAKASAPLPLGGFQIQALTNFYVDHIERCMTARLESYQRAFSESEQFPTDRDFTDILRETQAVRNLQVSHSRTALARFVNVRGGEVRQIPRLEEASAHGHDRVLRAWTVWRDKVRLHQGHEGARLAPSRPATTRKGPETEPGDSAKKSWHQVLRALWRWAVVGVVTGILFSFGGNAIYAGDVNGAGIFCFVGVFLPTAKFVLDTTRSLPHRVFVNLMAITMALVIFGLGLMLAYKRGSRIPSDAGAPSQTGPPFLTLQLSPSAVPVSVRPHSVTSVLQMHPYIAPTDKVDGLLKIANDTGQEGCWPSEKEMESVGLADHETIYHVEIVNHSQRTLASGRVAFGLKYNVGVKNGGCMAPPGVQFDQEDIVLIPPLEPGKSFDFFAVNQTNRCAWLVLPHSATVKWYGDNGNSDATLTFDKNPLYAAGAPVFPPTMINWEGVPSKPGGYGIVRTGVRACEHNPASTSPRRRHVLEEQNDRVLEEVSVVLYNDANDPAFSVDDKSMNPARYASGIATFRLPKGTHRIRAEYATRTCSLTFSLPLSEPGPVPANCRLKTGG